MRDNRLAALSVPPVFGPDRPTLFQTSLRFLLPGNPVTAIVTPTPYGSDPVGLIEVAPARREGGSALPGLGPAAPLEQQNPGVTSGGGSKPFAPGYEAGGLTVAPRYPAEVLAAPAPVLRAGESLPPPEQSVMAPDRGGGKLQFGSVPHMGPCKGDCPVMPTLADSIPRR